MRERVAELRAALAAKHDRNKPLVQQFGMSSLLPVASDSVTTPKTGHGIYLASPIPIDIAGLQTEQIHQFVNALLPHLIAS